MDVILEKEGAIATLTIERPEALNALNREIVDKLDEKLEIIWEDKDIRAVILYSRDNFAAGADIKAMAECDEEEARTFSFSETFNKLEKLPVPVIAAIEGYALGGGLELALAADLRIAAEDSKMGFPEITLGIMPGAGGTIRAPRMIGEARAKELIYTGRIVDGSAALSMGLVNMAVRREEVMQAAKRLAEKLAGMAPVAMRTAKETVRAGMEEPDFEKAVAIEADNWAGLFRTADQKEGMRAFIEKRKPHYQGR